MRDEKVTYTCDSCGKKANARKVEDQPGHFNNVLPLGWGIVSVTKSVAAPMNRARHNAHACSEDCAGDLAEDIMEERRTLFPVKKGN